MPNKANAYTEEFKSEAVSLARSRNSCISVITKGNCR